MPSPAIYTDGTFDPFDGGSSETIARRATLFYATDRQPVAPGDPQTSYNNERGLVLRTGVASVEVDPPIGTWEDARPIFLSPERDERYTLRTTATEETGIIPFSATDFVEDPPPAAETGAAGRGFAAQINAQLAQSSNKET